MKIAVVGSGITGNAAALALSQATHGNEVVIYEREAPRGRPFGDGGHRL